MTLDEARRSLPPHALITCFCGTGRFSALRASLVARDARIRSKVGHCPKPGNWAPSSYSAPKLATVAAVATFSAAR